MDVSRTFVQSTSQTMVPNQAGCLTATMSNGDQVEYHVDFSGVLSPRSSNVVIKRADGIPVVIFNSDYQGREAVKPLGFVPVAAAEAARPYTMAVVIDYLEAVQTYVAEHFGATASGSQVPGSWLAHTAVTGNATDLKYLKLALPGRKNSWALPAYS